MIYLAGGCIGVATALLLGGVSWRSWAAGCLLAVAMHLVARAECVGERREREAEPKSVDG